MTRSPHWVAGIMVAQRLPWLLFSLHAGAIADRVDRRRLLGMVETARMAVLLVIGIAVATDSLSLPLLYGAAATLGSLETLFSAASHAALPSLVRRPELAQANGYLQSGQIAGSQFVGPALGGVLFAAAAALPFVVDGVSFLVSAGLLAMALPQVRPVRRLAPSTTVTVDVVAGVRWFVTSPLLRLLALVVGVLSFCWAMVTAVTVLYGLEVLHLSGAGYGLFLAVGAAGEVAGGIVAGRVLRRYGTVAVVLGGALAATIAYVAIGLTSAILVAAAAMMAETFGIGIANVATMALRQSVVPAELLGRVGNAFRMCLFGAMPLGALAGGLLAQSSLRLPFFVAGAVQAALLVGCGPALARRIRAAEAATAQTAEAGSPVDLVDITIADGDIAVLELAG
jgi:MFS family permease